MSPADSRCYHVFVSYLQATERAVAEQLMHNLLRQRLSQYGSIVCFGDKQSILVGDNWQFKFLTALKRSCLCLSVISHADTKNTETASFPNESPDNVLLEYETALALAK